MKIETSKVFLFIMAILSILVVLFSTWFCYKYETYEPLSYVVPAIFTELGAATAGYYWKSKNENKIKMILGAVKKFQNIKSLVKNKLELLKRL